jgi:hypothetical protein
MRRWWLSKLDFIFLDDLVLVVVDCEEAGLEPP